MRQESPWWFRSLVTGRTQQHKCQMLTREVKTTVRKTKNPASQLSLPPKGDEVLSDGYTHRLPSLLPVGCLYIIFAVSVFICFCCLGPGTRPLLHMTDSHFTSMQFSQRISNLIRTKIVSSSELGPPLGHGRKMRLNCLSPGTFS